MATLETLLVALALGADPQLQAITTPRDAYPDFSPDGKTIVYQTNLSGRWHLWLIEIETGARKPLTEGDHDNYTPVFSPDGRRIAFASDRAGNRDVFVMNANGDDVRNITNHPGLDMHPEWTADGRIVFNSSRVHEDTSDVFVMDADGSDVRALTDDSSWDTYAAVSPDGRRLVWRHVVADEDNNSDVFVLDLDTGERDRLTSFPAFDGWPAWSPDGRLIALASNREAERWQDDQDFHIYLMTPDGRSATRLTPDDGYSYTQPAWSRDGMRMAAFRWIEDEVGEIGHLVVLDVPAGIRKRLTGEAAHDGIGSSD